MNLDTYTVSHWNEAKHVHERSILTAEQDFTFDALGFVVLPHVLSPAELSACRDSSTSGDGLGDLCSEDGAVGRYVRELCGDGFRQDGDARHVSAGAAGGYDEASLPLDGGLDTLDRAYINLSGWNGRNADGASLSRAGGAWEAVRIRECQGLLVVIALTDSACGKCPLVIVPSSHKSGLPAPPIPSSSPFAERPALAAGDVRGSMGRHRNRLSWRSVYRSGRRVMESMVRNALAAGISGNTVRHLYDRVRRWHTLASARTGRVSRS